VGSIFSIFRRSDNKLSYYNEVTGVTTVGPVITAGAWHELEVHVLINGTSSLVEVSLDGTRVLNKTAESLGTTGVGRVYIGDPATGKTFDFTYDNEVVSSAGSQPLSTPTGLTVTGNTLSSISLGWNAPTGNVGVVGYDVFVNGTRIGSTTGTSYTLSGLACGKSYTLGVDARDAAGNTSGQASVTASTASCSGQPPPDVIPPTIPTGLTVTNASQSTISLSWNAATDNVGVVGYDAFRDNSRVGTTNTTTYTFNGLSCGRAYTLGVDAFDAAGGVSARASITAASSPCGGDPSGPSPSAFTFPGDALLGNVKAVGTAFPGHACGDSSPSANCADEGGFNRSDYEGWSTGVNDRMSWAADPAGSGKTVARFEVYGDDSADQYGGTRTSLYRNADEQFGEEAWKAFGFYVPLDFQYPDQWFLLYQTFSGGGNPAQALELRGPDCGNGAPRTELCWKDQTASGSGRHYFDLGPVTPGHWTYIVENILVSTGSDGFDHVWRTGDAMPDVSKKPTSDWSGITAWGSKPSRSNLLLYRGASTHSQHQIVYFCGFTREASSGALALPNCPGA
jgi:chitodextrinase